MIMLGDCFALSSTEASSSYLQSSGCKYELEADSCLECFPRLSSFSKICDRNTKLLKLQLHWPAEDADEDADVQDGRRWPRTWKTSMQVDQWHFSSGVARIWKEQYC